MFGAVMVPTASGRAVSFFFNDTATTEIYTLSLHDALPIYFVTRLWEYDLRSYDPRSYSLGDRKSTRLNSSHLGISYAVFCLKKIEQADASHTIPDLSNFFRSTLRERVGH